MSTSSAIRWCFFAACIVGSSAQNVSSSSFKSSVPEQDAENIQFATYTLLSLACLAFAIAVYRVALSGVRHIRTITSLTNATQHYFRVPNPWFSTAKEYILYASLFRSRHMQELQLFRRWGMGVLPTRLQTLFLVGLIGMNVGLCIAGIEWSQAGTEAMSIHLRNRTGTLAVVNLIPLVIMAGRNNPLIKLLNVSFDTFNMAHRWFGRIMVAEAIAHTVAWAVEKVDTVGWGKLQESLRSSQLILTGTIAIFAAVFIVLQASALLRHAFYETFLHLHIFLVVIFLVFLYKHLQGLTQLIYVKVCIAAWAFERFIRLCTIVYRNLGHGGTVAIIEVLPADALRVTLKMARPWTFRPGQHVYLTLPSVGLWTNHPFSVAWSSSEDDLDSEKGLVMNQQDLLSNPKTNMSAIIRRRDGFTNALYKKAENAQGRLVLNALVEGPYGGLESLHSYGTVMIFAGGVGITHQVPYVRDLVTGFGSGTVATRKVILVWVIQSPEHLEWIRPWMTEILALDKRRDVLRIQLFVTRPRSTKEIHSPSATVQMFPGRPNVDTLVEMECRSQVGAMGVSVCGSGGLADDVRRAVRRRQGVSNIDFVQESYSW